MRVLALYGPDLNPIEQAFAELQPALRQPADQSAVAGGRPSAGPLISLDRSDAATSLTGRAMRRG